MKLQDLRNTRIEKEILAERIVIDEGESSIEEDTSDLMEEESALVDVIKSLSLSKVY